MFPAASFRHDRTFTERAAFWHNIWQREVVFDSRGVFLFSLSQAASLMDFQTYFFCRSLNEGASLSCSASLEFTDTFSHQFHHLLESEYGERMLLRILSWLFEGF